MRALATVLALLVASAAGATDVAAELRRCSGISDSLQRLVCYDALAGRTAAAPSPAPAATAPAPARATEYRSSRCAATTKKGTQCSRSAKPGSSYCWQHGG